MDTFGTDKAVLGELKKLLAAQIKLDIVKALREHPHMHAEASQQAFATLANEETVESLMRDLAREEVEAAVARGQLPAASFLHLAGYRQNTLAEG